MGELKYNDELKDVNPYQSKPHRASALLNRATVGVGATRSDTGGNSGWRGGVAQHGDNGEEESGVIGAGVGGEGWMGGEGSGHTRFELFTF